MANKYKLKGSQKQIEWANSIIGDTKKSLQIGPYWEGSKITKIKTDIDYLTYWENELIPALDSLVTNGSVTKEVKDKLEKECADFSEMYDCLINQTEMQSNNKFKSAAFWIDNRNTPKNLYNFFKCVEQIAGIKGLFSIVNFVEMK